MGQQRWKIESPNVKLVVYRLAIVRKVSQYYSPFYINDA
jgi:hypothetical protein